MNFKIEGKYWLESKCSADNCENESVFRHVTNEKDRQPRIYGYCGSHSTRSYLDARSEETKELSDAEFKLLKITGKIIYNEDDYFDLIFQNDPLGRVLIKYFDKQLNEIPIINLKQFIGRTVSWLEDFNLKKGKITNVTDDGKITIEPEVIILSINPGWADCKYASIIEIQHEKAEKIILQ